MVDLHTHSHASDGDFSPTQLVDLAADAGITALALTDHDTIAGLTEATIQAQKHGIRFIPGVEIEVEFRPGEFHLLGLGLHLDETEELEKFLVEIRQRRQRRNTTMIERMQADGLTISQKSLEELAGGDVVGRMHMARWLINAGKAKNVPEVFSQWLGPRCPYYVPRERPTLEEAIHAIHSAQGKAVLAHPLSLWISWGKMGERLAEWSKLGLDGVEARHSGASKREAARLEVLAEANGMFITGGSDFHGPGRPDRRLGRGAAGKPGDLELLEPFDEKN
ncbi:MAG: PHP domain-containing protein [Spirochaetales bacterium]|nr:PHP domain-containing protein [Spirochaetales bacterium]